VTDMNLSHHFLIAMPSMADPEFAGTVSYILQHDAQGAMGVIINRPSTYRLAEICESASISPVDALTGEHGVHLGGPVSSEQGFVLHRLSERVWQGSVDNGNLGLTTSTDILQALAQGEGPSDYIFCLGYSGWSEGQLEEELKQNAWLTVAADNDIIFAAEDPSKYQRALTLLGIDIAALSGHGGQA
jgi:putative transcriptional regulator